MRKEFVPKCRRLKSKANEKLIVNQCTYYKIRDPGGSMS